MALLLVKNMCLKLCKKSTILFTQVPAYHFMKWFPEQKLFVLISIINPKRFLFCLENLIDEKTRNRLFTEQNLRTCICT